MKRVWVELYDVEVEREGVMNQEKGGFRNQNPHLKIECHHFVGMDVEMSNL